MTSPLASTPTTGEVHPPVPDTPPRRPAKRLGFPKSRRVLERRDFQRIQGRGTRLPEKAMLVMAARQPGKPGPARLGITASRKSGESVQRSRMKRVVREAFRLHQEEFPRGWDFVVIVREGADRLGLADIVKQLLSALGRLKRGGGEPQRKAGSGSGSGSGRPPGARPSRGGKPAP
jgi:ribonuclease P protein component